MAFDGQGLSRYMAFAGHGLPGEVAFDGVHGPGKGRLFLTRLLLLFLALLLERVGVRIFSHDVDDILSVRVEPAFWQLAVFAN